MVLSLWRRQLRERAASNATLGRVLARQGLVFGQAQHFVTAGDHNGQRKYHLSSWPHLNYCHKRRCCCGWRNKWRETAAGLVLFHLSTSNRLLLRLNWTRIEIYLFQSLSLCYSVLVSSLGQCLRSLGVSVPHLHSFLRSSIKRVYRSIDRRISKTGRWLMTRVHPSHVNLARQTFQPPSE